MEEIKVDLHTLRMLHKKENIDLICEKKDSNAYLLTDKERLKEIILILIDNALKFTKNGQVTCGYEINDKNCMFFVADTGIGIQEENLPRIFERFVKLGDNQNEIYRGIGQGLYLTKKILELLGGNIWVESRKDVGSTFYFTIPLAS